MIEQVVGERRGGAVGGAAGDVAPAVVAAGVDLPCFVRAGCAGAIETGQFVWLAVTVQVLLLRASAVERSLPELAQAGVDKGVAVAGSALASV